MQFNWFQIFNLTDFLDTGLSSRVITPFLENYGEKEMIITKGNTNAITIDGEFLPIEFAGKNPYSQNGFAVYKDANANIYVGFEVEDEE